MEGPRGQNGFFRPLHRSARWPTSVRTSSSNPRGGSRRGLRDRSADSVQEPPLPVGGAADWGLNVARQVQQRARGQLGTRPAERRLVPGQGGQLTGITELNRGLVLDLQPGDDREGGRRARAAGWGYDARTARRGRQRALGRDLQPHAERTVNPDFSQVEADAGQFTYDPRTAVFFPEKRPFFLDGIEQFTTHQQPHLHAPHRERVAAAKLTGKDRRGHRPALRGGRPRGRRTGAATIRSTTSCASSATLARRA